MCERSSVLIHRSRQSHQRWQWREQDCGAVESRTREMGCHDSGHRSGIDRSQPLARLRGQWRERSTENTHHGVFPFWDLNVQLNCFNLWIWGEGCRSRGAGLALQPHLGGGLPLELRSACEQKEGLRMISF